MVTSKCKQYKTKKVCKQLLCLCVTHHNLFGMQGEYGKLNKAVNCFQYYMIFHLDYNSTTTMLQKNKIPIISSVK